MNITDIDKNKNDTINEITAKAINSACSFIPFVGTSISEFITSFIPDNRIERIVSFIKELSNVIEEHGNSIDKLTLWMDNLKSNKMKSFLFETVLLDSMKTESKIKWHCYAYYVFSIINEDKIQESQNEALLHTIEQLNEIEILHIIYLGYEKFLPNESEFHKNYGVYIDRRSEFGTDEDRKFNAMQDSYLNSILVKGITTCIGDPKKGNSSFELLPYGELIFQTIFDEKYFLKQSSM